MSIRKINDIAEDFAEYVINVAPQKDENGNMQYYFAGSMASILTCNAKSVSDENGDDTRNIDEESRCFLQTYFPRQTGDIDIITMDEEADVLSFCKIRENRRKINSSRAIVAAIPDSGAFCKAFFGDTYSSAFWDNLSWEHKVTHKVSKIETEKGNVFYVPRPDYQLANKMCEVVILKFEDCEKNKKNIKDISLMYAAFSKIYSPEEILDAFSVCLKDREDYGQLAQGHSAKACFRKIAPKMMTYLKDNTENSADVVARLQNMINSIEKPLNKGLSPMLIKHGKEI